MAWLLIAKFPRFDRAASPARLWHELGMYPAEAVPPAIFAPMESRAARALALAVRGRRRFLAPSPTSKNVAGQSGDFSARRAH